MMIAERAADWLKEASPWLTSVVARPAPGTKVGVLMESDYYEDEIFYYQHRFAGGGHRAPFPDPAVGPAALTFHGHEYKAPFEVTRELRGHGRRELRSYAAIIVPSAIVSDRLRYTEDVTKLPPATEFLARAFAEPDVVKGIICHGMWLVAPMPELVRGRPGGRPQQPARRRGQHGRDLHRPGCRGGRRPGHRPDRRALPPVRPRDHRHDRRQGGADGERTPDRLSPSKTSEGKGQMAMATSSSKRTSRRSDGSTMRRTRATTTSLTSSSRRTSRVTAARASRICTARPSSRN